MSTDQEVTEEKVDDGDNVVVPGFLLNALSRIPFMPQPTPHASGWQVEEVEVTMEGGSTKKMYFAVETRITGNEIRVYWYDMNTLREYAQTAMMVLQKLGAVTQANNPLLVANTSQMNSVIDEAKHTGIVLPR